MLYIEICEYTKKEIIKHDGLCLHNGNDELDRQEVEAFKKRQKTD